MVANANFTAGYYGLNILGLGWAQHTYVVAEVGGKSVNFQCYGGTDTAHKKDNSLYAADLYTPSLMHYKNKGRSVPGDLDVARFIVTGNPYAEPRDNYDWHSGGITKLGDNCGIVYAITGVCHQMAARVLYACNPPVVVWPPTVTSTYWIYYDPVPYATGFYGKLWGLIKAVYDRYEAIRKITDAEVADLRKMTQLSVAKHLEIGHTAEIRAPHIHNILTARLGFESAEQHIHGSLEKDLEFKTLKRDLDMQLLRGEISNREFAEASNKGFAKMAKELADILGDEKYQKVFGLSPDRDLTLSIDPEMMPESYEPIGIK